MYNFCVKYKKKEHKKPTCKTLLKVIDLAREAERLCIKVEEKYNGEKRFMCSYSGIIENFYISDNDLAQALNNNYKRLKLLIKDCGKCKKLATCNILDYVKKDTLKNLKES